MAVGRFQVMATLQAARAYEMGMPKESALSWGLNRAIFYAAAKRGFKTHHHPKGSEIKLPANEPIKEQDRARRSFKMEHLGDEEAYGINLDGKELFVFGEEIQTADDFDREIAKRFNGHFDQAWDDALSIIKKYGKDVLSSQSEFYDRIYRPRRDELAREWTDISRSATASRR